MKSKEYNFFRLTVFILTVLVFNFAILISDGIMYFIWFGISILSLVSVFLFEKETVIDLLTKPSKIRISRRIIFLLAFIIAYKNHYHYQLIEEVGYFIIALLQITNVILFIVVFCLEKRKITNMEA